MSGQTALLNRSDHDQRPLQALGPVRGQHPDRGTAQIGLVARIGRDLLGLDFGQEPGDATQTGYFLGPGGDGEQGADSVQVAVGPSPGITTERGVAPKAFRPPSARPQRPQCLLGRRTPRDLGHHRAEQRGQPAGRRHLTAGRQVLEPGGIGQRPVQQILRRAGKTGTGQYLLLRSSQGATQPADSHTVQPAERGRQQLLSLLTRQGQKPPRPGPIDGSGSCERPPPER